MANKPLSNEAIELTEKKMDMSLDEIIKLSKNKTAKPKNQRTPNKSNNSGGSFSRDKSAKAQKFMDTRSTMRQGALAQKRSSFQRNQFPLAAEAARKAAAVPIRNKPFGGTRAGNMNKMRAGPLSFQNRAVRNGGFNIKGSVPNGSQQFKQQSVVQPKPKPQTLDSMFANMKEERMRIMSRQNGNGQNAQNNGGRLGNTQNNDWRRSGNGQNNAGRRNWNGQNNAGRRNGNGQNNAGREYGNGQNNSGRRNGGQQLPPWQRGHFGQ